MIEDPIVSQIRRDLDELQISKSLKKLSESTVLITGASGMLGKYFTLALALMQLESGFQPSVVAVSRNAVPLFESLSIQNIRPQDTKGVILNGGVDVVLHAASPAHASVFMQDPATCFEVNVTWAEALARACLDTQTRFVYLSSGEVYGINPPIPTCETDFGGLDPVVPRNIYAVSKRAGEAVLSSLALGQHLDLRICRLFHTFGPGIRRGEPRLFGALLDSALDSNDCTIIGNAEATRCFLYSFDALNGISYVLDNFPSGAAVNVAGSRAYTIRETALRSMSAMTHGKSGAQFTQASVSFAQIASQIVRSEADNSLLRNSGWLPQVDLDESFVRTLNSFSHE